MFFFDLLQKNSKFIKLLTFLPKKEYNCSHIKSFLVLVDYVEILKNDA